MQSVGPYRVVRALGSCQVGTVWWATDELGRGLTVATLDPRVAVDPQWRDGFASTAAAMAGPEGGSIPYHAADFAAPAPWVAYVPSAGPGAEGVFRRLGMDYQPVSGDPAAEPSSFPSSPAGPGDGALAWPEPTSAAPDPRQSSAPPDQQWAAAPDMFQVSGPPDQSPFARRIPPSPPPKRRTGLLVGIGALVVVLLAVGGLVVWRFLPGGDDPVVAPTPGPTGVPSAPATVALPAAPPSQPGAEPPKAGEWPRQWVSFVPSDNISTLTDLPGLGFTVKVPHDWKCAPAGQSPGFAKYTCGMSPAGDVEAGGELIVRDCAQPCHGQRQAEMRRAEEAWGLRWSKAGPSSFIVESNAVQVDGRTMYGLVVVAYYRSGAAGTIDRQLVLRMTAHPDKANTVRRVANYLRDTLIF
ncbi:hypothetical protein [Spirilliplanes yamanashiensis]|uniref:Uncharacterized protein n=1 Tax=Spirilliplanes yamanashiensis TaxID=42233 RepID=A0A8J3Y6T7_9ACTN|nr:hypothetical protein [Spirilliplanes yamanashiensis]MDP9814785.1 hypothetical protein [Spirilliplanes yamanashiensis]GIJ02439.1 hypothetical protein Sya03_17910 [Spirilliplanes yamanashiensis]